MQIYICITIGKALNIVETYRHRNFLVFRLSLFLISRKAKMKFIAIPCSKSNLNGEHFVEIPLCRSMISNKRAD